MRMLVAVAALLTAACSAMSPQSAYADAREDFAPVLARCIAEASDENALRSCRGEITRLCTAGDDTSMGLTLCLSDEADAWDAQLNAVLARANTAEPWRVEELAAAQTAWKAWLESECSYRADSEQGGSGQQVDLAQCYVDHTSARAIEYILRVRGLP